MKATYLFLAVAMSATLAACSHDSGGDSGTVVIPVNPLNSVSGYCGSTVVSDNNAAALNCQFMKIKKPEEFTKAESTLCRDGWQSFVDKYPNASCEAKNVPDDGTTITVSSSDRKKVIDALNTLIPFLQ